MDLLALFSNFGVFIVNEILPSLFFWTFIAGILTYYFKKSPALNPSMQYEGRLALLFTLPAAITGSLLYEWISSLPVASQALPLSLIQLPLPAVLITPQAGSPDSTLLYNPYFWIGLLGLCMLLMIAIKIVQIIWQFISLNNLQNQLNLRPLTKSDFIKPGLFTEFCDQSIMLGYSKNTEIPFTYGQLSPNIILPENLKNQPIKKELALKHELMHIRHHDFLVHSMVLLIQAVFWFHPIVRLLVDSISEYREIIRDEELLSADRTFPRKSYASLLYEFATKNTTRPLVMQMAVSPSTLKKRIQIMSTQKPFTSTLRTGSLIIFSAALLVVGTLSCTDITSDGLTTSEFTQAQQQMEKKSGFQVESSSDPVFYVNDKKYDSAKGRQIVSRLKPKYIKSIQVYKDQKAIEKFGQEGENGVVILTLHEGVEQKALQDLKSPEEMTKAPQKATTGDDVYMVTEEMPQLIGGIAAIQKQVVYPQEAKEKGIEGRVIVQFIVDEEGNVTEPTIVKGIGGGCDEAALQAVKTATFKPGKQRDKPVKVQFTLPITFAL